jgi:hypothetical protein
MAVGGDSRVFVAVYQSVVEIHYKSLRRGRVDVGVSRRDKAVALSHSVMH